MKEVVPVPPTVDYSQKWKVMAAVAMGVLLGTIDASIVNVALPTLVREFGTALAQVQWVVLGYLVTMAGLTLLVGRLGDIAGKKRMFTIGFALFTTASALCGLSPTIGFLVGARVLQALGAAMVIALGTAILTEAFPPTERGKALGIIGTVVSMGIISGPVIGGLLIGTVGWRWIFLVNLPVGLLGLLMAARFVPATPPVGNQRFDLAGAALLAATLVCLTLALTFGQEAGYGSLPILGLFLLAAVAGTVFVRVELSRASPMIELHLLRNPDLSVGVVTGLLAFTALIGLIFVLPFYLENVLGLDPAQTGRLLAIGPLAAGVIAPLAGHVADRMGSRRLTLAGLVILALAMLNARRLAVDTSVAEYVVIAIPVGIGIGTFQSPNNSAIMGSVDRRYTGLAGGMVTVTRLLGQVAGIALLGSFWGARVVAGGGSLTSAPPEAQVEAAQATFLLAAVLVGLGALLAAWAFVRDRGRTSPQHSMP